MFAKPAHVLRSLLAIAWLGTATAAVAQPPQFAVVDLGAQVQAGDVWRSYAFDINDVGQVTGYALLSGGGKKALLWSNGTAPILNPGLYDDRTPNALNDAGVMVGGSPGVSVGWAYNGLEFRCVPEFNWCASFDYIWSASTPFDINNAGTFTGGISQPDGSLPVEAYTATISGNGEIVVQRLGAYNGQNTTAYGINELGDLVAWSGPWYDSDSVLYRAGTWYELPTLGGEYNKPEAINESGFAVGYVSEPGQTQWPYAGEAVVWDTTDPTAITLQTLGKLPGSILSWAYDINDGNAVVGTSTYWDSNTDPAALLWLDGTLYNLNDLIPPDSPWVLQAAYAINNSNQIVGVGLKTDVSNAYRAFLLQPTLPAAAIGDMNCDGAHNAADIDPFVMAVTNRDDYSQMFPDCEMMRADANGDGSVNAADIDAFVQVLAGD